MQQSSETEYTTAVMALDKLIQKQKPLTSTALKSFVVALYTADDMNPLRFCEKIGLLQLDFDRTAKSHFLRFYDLQSLRLLMQMELYYGFGENYRNHSIPTLYIFDYFAEGVIGFQFRNEEQAQLMQIKIKSVCPKIEVFREMQKQRLEKELEEKKSNTFFGRMKKKIFGNEEEPEHQESVIVNVEKQKSININFQTGEFNLTNIPPQWQEIFDSLELKKEDLKDKEVMKFIFEETIVHQAKKTAEQHPQLIKEKHLQLIKEETTEQCPSDNSSVEEVDLKKEKMLIPPPPPPPQLSEKSIQDSEAKSSSRSDLMAQIRNNKLKLKPVKTTDKGIELDASSMNRQERKDLAEHLRMKLKRRKMALNRRNASDDEDSDSN